MKEVYIITFDYHDKQSFIDEYLKHLDVDIVYMYVTIPKLLKIRTAPEVISEIEEISCVVKCEDAAPDGEVDVRYDPIRIYEEGDLPALGVDARHLRQHLGTEIYFDTALPISASYNLRSNEYSDNPAYKVIGYGSRSNDYDHTEDIKQVTRHVTDSFKTLPIPWAPWRMTLPLHPLTASDNEVTSYVPTELTFLDQSLPTNPDPTLAVDDEGNVIEEETTTNVVGQSDRHDITLEADFNTISTFIDTTGINMRDIVTGSLYNTVTGQYVAPHVATGSDSPYVLIKNNEGAVINFRQDDTFNGIGNWNPHEGYQIKMSSNDYQLRISGSVHKSISYTLQPGIYIMSFPSTTEIDPSTLFDGQLDNIDQIKNNAGQIFAPPNTSANNTNTLFNGIGNLTPGQGYQIKVINNPVTVTIVNEEVIIPGCTNPRAANYDPNATQDDGSCIVYGCTDSEASNYNPSATRDDGTCLLPIRESESHIIKLPPESLKKTTNVFYISTFIDTSDLETVSNLSIELSQLLYNRIYKETDTTFSTVSDISDIVEVIKDVNEGSSWAPAQGPTTSNIGDLLPARGYQVQLMSNRDTTIRYEFRIPGSNVSTYTFNLSSGYNFIGSPFTTPINVETMFAPISDIVINMTSNLGKIWQPAMGFNDIGDMIPGEGYILKLSEDATLVAIG